MIALRVPALALLMWLFLAAAAWADTAPMLTIAGQPGAATVTWDTGTGAPGQVYVSANAGPEELFAEGPSGSQQAPWITGTTRYEFRLYAGTAHAQQLTSASVGPATTGEPVRPSLPVTVTAVLLFLGADAAVVLATPLSHRARQILAVAAIAAAIVPVLTAVPRPLAQQPFPDSAEYADAAAQLAHGHGYVTAVHGNGPEPPRYPPGFSLALAPFAAFGDYPANVQLGATAFAALYVIVASAVAWRLGGPPAGALTAAFIGVSPFAAVSAAVVLSDALAATLTLPLLALAGSANLRRGVLAGVLAGLVSSLRLSAVVGLVALVVATRGRVRLAVVAGAAPVLAALGVFQWLTFGSPLRTGYDYWLPGVRNFDLAYATASPPFGDGPWIVADRLNGWLLAWTCPCAVGGPQASLPSLVYYPAILLGAFWIFAPPLTTLLGLAYAWSRRRQAEGRFAAMLVLLSLVFYEVYYYQGARFVAAPATVLAICGAVAVTRLVDAWQPRGRSVPSPLARPAN